MITQRIYTFDVSNCFHLSHLTYPTYIYIYHWNYSLCFEYGYRVDERGFVIQPTGGYSETLNLVFKCLSLARGTRPPRTVLQEALQLTWRAKTERRRKLQGSACQRQAVTTRDVCNTYLVLFVVISMMLSLLGSRRRKYAYRKYKTISEEAHKFFMSANMELQSKRISIVVLAGIEWSGVWAQSLAETRTCESHPRHCVPRRLWVVTIEISRPLKHSNKVIIARSATRSAILGVEESS